MSFELVSLLLGGVAIIGALSLLLDRFITSSGIDEEKKKSLRRVCTCVHHIVVASMGLLGSRTACIVGLMLEFGFEIVDSCWTLFGGSSWTGLPGVAVYVHHILSASLELVALQHVMSGTVSFVVVAPFLCIFIGSGALDLCWAKLLVFPRHSAKQWIVTSIYTLGFVYLRLFWFAKQSLLLLTVVWELPGFVKVIVHAMVIVFSLYHALLGIGIIFAWRHGGRLPDKKMKE